MVQTAPDRAKKEKKKPMGRPVRAQKNLQGTDTDVAEQEKETLSATSPVQHVVEEVSDELSSSTQQEAISTRNVASAITTENQSELISVRKTISTSRLFLLALFLGLILGTIIFGGLSYYNTQGSNFLGVFERKISPTPTIELTPTKVPLNLADYSVQILNGSGVPGAAGEVERLLNGIGFAQTTTGNASEYGYVDTEVAMKSNVPDEVFTKLKETLSDYNVVEVTSLPSDARYDVVITVGTKK